MSVTHVPVNKETYFGELPDKFPNTSERAPVADPLMVAPVPRLLFRSRVFDHSLVLSYRREWVIGRARQNQIIIPERLASRQHALIRSSSPSSFTLLDLNSRNGVYVNEQRVNQQVNLNNGDLITIGDTELRFRCPSGGVSIGLANESTRTVLMTHAARVQGQIWREVLASQGVSVAWPDNDVDLVETLQYQDSIGHLPDLLLVDLAATSNNPYEFCRWCTNQFPKLKIILLSSTRTDLYDSERRWATRQGAAELFPAFATQRLFSSIADIAEKVRLVLQTLGWQPLEHSSLVFTLLGLQEQIRNEELL